MQTFFFKLNVSPTERNQHKDLVDKVLTCCWVLENNPETAIHRAIFDIEKFDWKFESIEQPPIETTREDFSDRDLGLEQYDNAQKDGIAITYLGCSKDGTTHGPFKLEPNYKFNISDYIKIQNENKEKGRCLHYESGQRCDSYINAHSIQKSGLLKKISRDGHIYGLAFNYGTLVKNGGKATYKKQGINKFSTFFGFCKKHDNQIFEPIDNLPLKPTNQQVFLYSYRSLCREIFVKENALNNYNYQTSQMDQPAIKKQFEYLAKGTAWGLENLMKQKREYDISLENKQYQDIQYVLFTSEQKPNIVFSGLLYPDFDFIGRQLQDLSDQSKELELITFCSAQLKNGWGFLFAWHKSSEKVCKQFIESLATAMYENDNNTDFLFRLALTVENHAIAPSWWDTVTDENKNKITDRFSELANLHARTQYWYLMNGLEGISNWKFVKVISNENPLN